MLSLFRRGIGESGGGRDDPDEETAFTGFDWGATAGAAAVDNSLPKKGNDGRLFPEYLLYCEGLEKPFCRGLLHLFATLILPFGMLHLLREADNNDLGRAAGTLYVFSNIFCYGISALYHVGRWSPRVEILLQKWDHCGIAILSVGTFLPSTLLLFPRFYGSLLLSCLLATCGYACWNIWRNNKATVLQQVLVPGSSLLFLPVFYATLNRLEFILYFVVVAFQLAGVFVFVNNKPNPWPKIFGHHEVFHCFVVAAGVSIYVANWSIIRRTCQPFAHDQAVNVLLFRALRSLFLTE